MNKKQGIAAGLTLLLLTTPLLARDYTPESLHGDLEGSLRRNEVRRESTRQIGNDLPRTQQIAPIHGSQPAYIHRDHSGTYLLNNLGQPVGIIGR